MQIKNRKQENLIYHLFKIILSFVLTISRPSRNLRFDFCFFTLPLHSLEYANKVLEFMIIPAIVTSIRFFWYNCLLSLMVLKGNAMQCHLTVSYNKVTFKIEKLEKEKMSGEEINAECLNIYWFHGLTWCCWACSWRLTG